MTAYRKMLTPRLSTWCPVALGGRELQLPAPRARSSDNSRASVKYLSVDNAIRQWPYKMYGAQKAGSCHLAPASPLANSRFVWASACGYDPPSLTFSKNRPTNAAELASLTGQRVRIVFWLPAAHILNGARPRLHRRRSLPGRSRRRKERLDRSERKYLSIRLR